MTQLGFLGLGSMGMGMARRLLQAGHDVVVWNRSPESVAVLVAEGARAARDPAEALASGASFSMFATDAVATDVLTLENLRASAGGFHANMASVSPRCSASLEQRCASLGVSYIASPVLGRPEVAAAGALNIVAAGPAETLREAQPFFDLMGKKTWVVGDRPEVANVVKVAVNYNIIHAIQALGESLALVESHGVNASEFTTLLSETLFGGVVYQGYGDLIARRAYQPQGFSLALGKKDLGLAQEIASSAGVELRSAPVLQEMFDEALSRPDFADCDWAVLAEIARSQDRE